MDSDPEPEREPPKFVVWIVQGLLQEALPVQGTRESLITLSILRSHGNPLGAGGLGYGGDSPEPHVFPAGKPWTRSRASRASCSPVSLALCPQRLSSVLSTTEQVCNGTIFKGHSGFRVSFTHFKEQWGDPSW